MPTLEELAPKPQHVYGWKRPLPGLGALDLLSRADLTEMTVLPEVDPRLMMPPIFNQGQLGSCTANATAACLQYDAITDGHDCGELSRRWIYHFEKALEHTLGRGDTGAYGHDAFTVASHGIPNESLYPYSEDISEVEAKPPNIEPRAYTLKKPVHAVPQEEATVRRVLSNRQTIAVGFTVYESFEAAWAEMGVMPVPKPGEWVLGGHEVLVIGYLQSHPDHFLARNSWGPEWGLGGYFLFPKIVLLDGTQASDLRTVARPA